MKKFGTFFPKTPQNLDQKRSNFNKFFQCLPERIYQNGSNKCCRAHQDELNEVLHAYGRHGRAISPSVGAVDTVSKNFKFPPRKFLYRVTQIIWQL